MAIVTIETIAKAAHELNKFYCETIGDYSQLEWDDAPEWQRTSAINGVQFHIDNPDATESASHDSWLAEKEADGWVYGEVKDAEAKTHPCMMPYDELPEPQKVKDSLFIHAVHTLLPMLGEDVDDDLISIATQED